MAQSKQESCERGEISLHEAKLYSFMKNNGSCWLTNKELAAQSGLKDRTVRLHTSRWSKLGIADCAEVFPGHRYRIAAMAPKRNAAYLQRLEEALLVFGDLVNGEFVTLADQRKGRR